MLQLDPLDGRLGDLRMLRMLRGGGRRAQRLQRNPRVDHHGYGSALRRYQDRRAGELPQHLHDVPVVSHLIIGLGPDQRHSDPAQDLVEGRDELQVLQLVARDQQRPDPVDR